MPDDPITARFLDLVATLSGHQGVTVGSAGRRFGSGALQVEGRIFAMVSGGRLVLKLPSARVAELLAVGVGDPFDAGKGRPLREWVSLRARQGDQWLSLAREARDFVAGRR